MGILIDIDRRRRRGLRRIGSVAGAVGVLVASAAGAPLAAESAPAGAAGSATSAEIFEASAPRTGASTGDDGAEWQAASGTVGAGVELDQLLRLPSSYEKPAAGSGGEDQVWRSRFAEGRSRIRESQATLDEAVKEMEETAGGSGQYAIAPPGASGDPTAGPVSYRLRAQIRRHRESVDQAERDYRALVIEADLAEVPDEWRRPEGVGAAE